MDDRPVLLIGSKNYSSWSLRAWLFLRKTGIEFQERIVHFDAPDYRARIAELSPSRRVPLLIDGELKVWDSLAICEYAAEKAALGLPREPAARALARSLAAEMHAGFQALREQCPMNVRALGRRVPQTPDLLADIARIDELWSDCRLRFGGSGEWLFGAFSIPDAMFAPVGFRLRTYGASLSERAGVYLRHLLADPLMREWQQASLREEHPLPEVDRIGFIAGASSTDHA
jgi:glutathione S-transferase